VTAAVIVRHDAALSVLHTQKTRYDVNYGGFTALWDRICGTIRPKFEGDFDKLKARLSKRRETLPPHGALAEDA
jgi:lathosterol oxidase